MKANNKPPVFDVVFFDGSFVELRIDRLSSGEKTTEKKSSSSERVMITVENDERGAARIVAFFIEDKVCDTYAVSASLKEILPEYMFPGLLIAVDQFPAVPKKIIEKNNSNWGKLLNIAIPDDASFIVIQQYLLDIWESLLQIEVASDVSFFELGGNSLLAGFLTFRINICFGISMPLHWIFEVPTISTLADRIHKAHTHAGLLDTRINSMEVQKSVKVAHLKPSKTLQPFFFCPPLEGLQPTRSVDGVINMAFLLSDTLGFYSIHPPALQPELLTRLKNNDDINMEDISFDKMLFENIVEEAVAGILNIQRSGPYWLGGYCTGCLMATAIGDLLTKKGKVVERMLLLDAPLWVEEINKKNVWTRYTRNDIIWFVSYDIGKDFEGMDWSSVCNLAKDVPDENIWQIMLQFILEKNALPKTTTVKDLKSAFEQKFFNYPAVRYYLDLINYHYPSNKVVSSLLLYSTSMYKTLPPGLDQYLKTNILLGDVCIKKIPVSHLGVFQLNDLISWIDAIREYLQK